MSLLTTVLILICSGAKLACTASHACVGVAQREHADPSEESRSDDIQLLQTFSRMNNRAKDSQCLPSSQLFKSGQHLSEEQILAELQQAKHAHQQWEDHIASLKTLLAIPRNITDEVNLSSSTGESSSSFSTAFYLIIVIVISASVSLFAVGSAFNYEKRRDKEHDEPWYHNDDTLRRASISAGILWLTIGTFLCTNVILFNGHRHLTLTESLYLSAQIVTTVGYGDLTTVTPAGELFKIFYCFLGVAVTAGLLTQLIEWYMEKSEKKLKRLMGGEITAILVPCLLCLVAGTVIFTLLPGEEKSVLEACYMSTITLLTIGFGDFYPTTATGKLISTIWMLIGVSFVGKGLVDFVEAVFVDKRRYRSKAAAVRYFKEVSNKYNEIGRAEFLRFELVRTGLDEDDFEEALQKFEQFDSSNNGKMDLTEFTNYVDVVLRSVKK